LKCPWPVYFQVPDDKREDTIAAEEYRYVFIIASSNGQMAIINHLLNEGLISRQELFIQAIDSTDSRTTGEIALILAARQGRQEVVKFLTSHPFAYDQWSPSAAEAVRIAEITGHRDIA